MALTKVEKELIEEKFKGVYARLDANFEAINSSLHNIETGFTNRLSDVEERTDGIDKELIEYRVIKKYPKAVIIVLAISVILFLFSISSAVTANQRLKASNSRSEIVQKNEKIG